jgi:hypothetical protein
LTDDVWRGLEQLHSGEHKVPYSVAKHNVAASSDVAELKRAWQTFLSQYMGISEMGRKGLLEGMHQLVEKAKHVAEGEGLPVTVRQLSAQETKYCTSRLYRHHVVRALRRLRGRSNLKKVSVTEKAMTRQRANPLLRQDNDVYVAGHDLQQQQLPIITAAGRPRTVMSGIAYGGNFGTKKATSRGMKPRRGQSATAVGVCAAPPAAAISKPRKAARRKVRKPIVK